MRETSENVLSVTFYIILMFFAVIGVNTLIHHEKYPTEIQYYENDIKTEAIMYNNKLFIRK